ncbi:hypothetical protein [Nonomuraea turcica]|uniref:hypothetical protein n=1 Tax=Nonomuraea sp. G32 TaxID=3067274 RepID=UPI00273B04DE|nr:hypothetical protein [Nonomuraea sp. G32]MDP4505084.1 hypothetical protein [Nonomuraea sp. G32]
MSEHPPPANGRQPHRRRQVSPTAVAIAATVLGLLANLATSTISLDVSPATMWLITLGLLAIGIVITWRVRVREHRAPTSAPDQGELLQLRVQRVSDAFDHANNAFADATTLMEELRQELATQEAAHRQLVAEAEHQRTLINMDRAEAEAVQAIILSHTQTDARRQRVREWSFFGAGLLLAVPINILSDLIGPK